MKYFCYSLIFFLALGLMVCKKNSLEKVNESDSFGVEDSLPIQIQGLREGNNVLISIQPQSGFGIQIEAPNKLEVHPLDNIVILNQDLNFKGEPNLEKQEYYSSIQPLNLTVNGEGNLQLSGKLFYCDFSKNICIPGKLNRKLIIQ